MNTITRLQQLAETYFVTVSPGLEFRIEVSRDDNGAPVQVIHFFSRVYLLRDENGMNPRIEGRDMTFRKEWVLVNELPVIECSSPVEVRDQIMRELPKFVDAYLEKYPRTPLPV